MPSPTEISRVRSGRLAGPPGAPLVPDVGTHGHFARFGADPSVVCVAFHRRCRDADGETAHGPSPRTVP